MMFDRGKKLVKLRKITKITWSTKWTIIFSSFCTD